MCTFVIYGLKSISRTLLIIYLSHVGPATIGHFEFLISIYVELDLYSNIPHDLGTKAIGYWINFPYFINGQFLKTFIFQSLKFLLENNCTHAFRWEDI